MGAASAHSCVWGDKAAGGTRQATAQAGPGRPLRPLSAPGVACAGGRAGLGTATQRQHTAAPLDAATSHTGGVRAEGATDRAARGAHRDGERARRTRPRGQRLAPGLLSSSRCLLAGVGTCHLLPAPPRSPGGKRCPLSASLLHLTEPSHQRRGVLPPADQGAGGRGVRLAHLHRCTQQAHGAPARGGEQSAPGLTAALLTMLC